jgi:hypothetical protein
MFNSFVFLLFRHSTLAASTGKLCLHKLVVNAPQALAQMQHGITFAREERVHGYAGLGGDFLKSTSLELVRYEYFALFLG